MIPSFSPSARSILSFLNGVHSISPKLPLFSCPPTLFFKDSDFLFKYPFIDGKPLHYFSSMFLSGDSQEDTNGASSSSFFVSFIFSGGFKSSFVDHILSSFQCVLMPEHLLMIHSCRPSFRHIGVMFPDFAFLTRSGDLWDPLDSSL